MLASLYQNTLFPRENLCIFKAEYAWHLHVDLLVLDELQIWQFDMLCLAVREAAQDMRLPQVVATVNHNSNKIEVGLVEEIYTDRDGADQLMPVEKCENAPYVVTVGVLRGNQSDVVLLGLDQIETQCVDQLLHIAVSKDLRIQGF